MTFCKNSLTVDLLGGSRLFVVKTKIRLFDRPAVAQLRGCTVQPDLAGTQHVNAISLFDNSVGALLVDEQR